MMSELKYMVVPLICPLGWNELNIVRIESELGGLFVDVLCVVGKGGRGGRTMFVGDHDGTGRGAVSANVAWWPVVAEEHVPYLSFLLKCDLKGLQFVLWPSYNLKFYIPIPQNQLTFDQILQQAELPNPGPEYYEARRRLWLTPRMVPSPRGLSSAREKLEEILSRPNAVHSINLWNNGLERVWKGLSSGGNLKIRLPMALVVRILQSFFL
jgi:hypothetical protein